MIRQISVAAMLGVLVSGATLGSRAMAGGPEAQHRRVPPNATTVSGVLHDEAGRALAHTTVLSCMSTVCLASDSDAAGNFTFTIEFPARIALKTVEDLAATPRRGAALLPLQVSGPPAVRAGVLVVPSLPAAAPIGSTGGGAVAVQAGDGLELALRRPALKPPPGYAINGVAARRLSDAVAASYPRPDGETVVAVYALHPFGTTSEEPIAVRAATRLAAGTRVAFRTISEIDGAWSAPVQGVASATSVTTSPGLGITELTYLVISIVK